MSDLLLFPTRPRSPVAGTLLLGTLRSPASTQLAGLQAYYSLEEAAGVRQDRIAPGIGPAAKFTRANNEFLSRADAAGLEPTTSDFTVCAWVMFEGTLSPDQTVIAKSNGTGNQRGWRIGKQATTNLFQFQVSSTGATFTTITTTEVAALNTWYFVVAWRDAAANQIYIQINNGTVFSAAQTGGVFDGTALVELGRAGTVSNALDGRLQGCALWIGAGAVLTAAQREALYNGGNGLTYAQLGAEIKAALVSWWPCTEFSTGAGAISRADAHGANTLTDNNTTTTATGNAGNGLHDTNTVTANTGKVGTAAEFVIANSEQLVAPDSPALRGEDVDFELAFWVRFAAVATDQTLFSKDTGSAGLREYRCDFLTATAKITFIVYDGTTAVGTVTTTPTFSAGTFYYIRVFHDAVNNLVGISVDGAAAETAATTGAPLGTLAPFRVGANGSGTPQFFGGRIDEFGKWNRIRTAGEVAADYNGGSGRAYPKSSGGVL
jgi:hypothetical protein